LLKLGYPVVVVLLTAMLARTDTQPQGLIARRGVAGWPLFRGNPFQTGVATSPLPAELGIRWTVKTKDSIESAAAIVAGTVYVGSMDERLRALDLKTGQEKWAYKAAPFKAPPSVLDGLVYVGDVDGVFHCVEAATGKKRWTYETGQEISSGANFTRDGILFGSADETLYCLGKDGKERWKFKVPGGPVLGSPAIVGNRTFAAGCDSSLHVLDTNTGKQVAPPVDLGGQVGATVAIVGDHLYIGTMSSEVLAIDWKKGSIDWRFAADNRRQPFYASAAVTDKLVVVASRDKHVYALDRQTGQQVWAFPTRNKVDGSPVVVDTRVVVGSLDKNLYVLDLAKGTELQKFDLGSPINASPAVAEGCLVVGTSDGAVYCLGAKN
jgi:outer membrane protein assembly factor BamB